MKSTPKAGRSELSLDNVGTLLVIASVLLGGWFRVFPAFLAGYPVNDGGMFYVMIKDLQTNHYLLPFYTSYNNLNIPFAYPPLAFYVGAVVSDILHVSPIEIVRWLPGFVNTLCISAFYFLAKEITGNKLTSAASVFIYALIPHMSEWLSMGGGLTRSFGMLFMTLTVLYAYRLFTKDSHNDLWRTILFGSFAVLSHPESIVYTLGICAYVWLAKSHALKGFLNGIFVSIGILLITAPWYRLVVYRHGIETLVSAIQTGKYSLWSSFTLLNMDGITAEPYLDLLGVLCVLGIAILIIKKQYFIPGMLIVIYLVGPRSAHTIGNIALAMGGGFFVTEVILPVMSRTDGKSENATIGTLGRGVVILLVITIPYLLLNSIYQGFLISQNHIKEMERTAMQWVMDNTPASSQFLVLTGNADAMCDSVSEWFPSLTKRTSLTTVQGREWLPDVKFNEFINKRIDIQQCINGDLKCVDQQIAYFTTDLDYIFVSNTPMTSRCVPSDAAFLKMRGIVVALNASSSYALVYNAKDIFIFKRKK